MPNTILFENAALFQISEGVKIIAQAVGVTMGPNGKNVIISRDNALLSTRDGVTVAREVTVDNPLQSIGVQLIKQISQKTAFEAGDGTTTSTILAASIFEEGYNSLKGMVNPIEMKVGMEMQTKLIVEELKKRSIKVKKKDYKTIKNIATISANNDEEIGSLISECFKEIGFDGVISVQESRTSETYIEIAEGLNFDQGYISPYFGINQKELIEFDNPLIFIYDGRINGLMEIFTMLEQASLRKQPIVIICDGIEMEALNAVLLNCRNAKLQACIIKSPAYGDHRFNILNDIAEMVGAFVITPKNGVLINEISKTEILNYPGTCTKIEISSVSTSIIGAKGDENVINNRISQLRESMLIENNKSKKLLLQERLARLTNGVAILKVGANSELELKEKLERIDDSLSATRAAIAEGYIPGGGITLFNISNSLSTISENVNIQHGINAINSACAAPFKKIIENSNKNINEIIIRINSSEDPINFGYNAKTDTVEDLINSGVIDPVKVTRCSLENALSVAALMLTTGAMMVRTNDTNLLYNPNL